jgi:hypothetical protein
MFCPQCNQQQVSADVRFCSRCGFPLGVVSELIAHGGHLPALASSETEARTLSPRQRGARKGALVMIGAFALALIALLLTLMKEDFFVLLPLVALIFVGGLVRTLYARLLEEDAPRPRRAEKSQAALAGDATRAGELPPMRSVPASAFAQPTPSVTAEMAQPPSVTESTTRLLQEDK